MVVSQPLASNVSMRGALAPPAEGDGTVTPTVAAALVAHPPAARPALTSATLRSGAFAATAT